MEPLRMVLVLVEAIVGLSFLPALLVLPFWLGRRSGRRRKAAPARRSVRQAESLSELKRAAAPVIVEEAVAAPEPERGPPIILTRLPQPNPVPRVEGAGDAEIELPDLPELFLAEPLADAEQEAVAELLLIVLASLYSVSALRIPPPRPRESWSSLQESLDKIYDTLVGRRLREQGLEPGSRLFAQVRRAAWIGAATGSSDGAAWN